MLAVLYLSRIAYNTPGGRRTAQLRLLESVRSKKTPKPVDLSL